MRSQAERDQQTITIATVLAIFVGVLMTGVLLGVAVNAINDIPAGVVSALTSATLILAGIVSIAYLLRHRRP